MTGLGSSNIGTQIYMAGRKSRYKFVQQTESAMQYSVRLPCCIRGCQGYIVRYWDHYYCTYQNPEPGIRTGSS